MLTTPFNRYLLAFVLTILISFSARAQPPAPVILNLSNLPTSVTTSISGTQIAGVYFQLGFRNNQLVIAQSDTSAAFPLRPVLDGWYKYWLNNQLKIASSPELQVIFSLPQQAQKGFTALQPVLQAYERMFNGIGSKLRVSLWLPQYTNNIMRPAPTYVSAIVPPNPALDSVQLKRVFAFSTTTLPANAPAGPRPFIISVPPADSALAELLTRPFAKSTPLYLLSLNPKTLLTLTQTKPLLDTLSAFAPKYRADVTAAPVKNLIIISLCPPQGALNLVAGSKSIALFKSTSLVTQYKSGITQTQPQLTQAFKPYSIQSAAIEFDKQSRADSLMGSLTGLRQQKAGFYLSIRLTHVTALERVLPLLLKFADADGQTLVVCHVEDQATNTCPTFNYGPSSATLNGVYSLPAYILKIKNALLSARHSYNSNN